MTQFSVFYPSVMAVVSPCTALSIQNICKQDGVYHKWTIPSERNRREIEQGCHSNRTCDQKHWEKQNKTKKDYRSLLRYFSEQIDVNF